MDTRAETKDRRVYHPAVVNSHPVDNRFKTTFAEVMHKDYGELTYGFSQDVLGMTCIDHDSWEKSISGNDDKTMDCSTGIAAFECTRRAYSAHRHLLVELKLKCRSHTLHKEDYLGKIRHSRALLAGSPQHPDNVFIFIDAVQRKAKSDLTQWGRGTGGSIFRTILPLTPDGFNSFIGFEHQFPYKPVNDAQAIENHLKTNAGDAGALCKALDFWKKKVTYYIGVYQTSEAKHICDTITSLRDTLLRDYHPGTEDGDIIRFYLDDFK